jgi:hypothetical protein
LPVAGFSGNRQPATEHLPPLFLIQEKTIRMKQLFWAGTLCALLWLTGCSERTGSDSKMEPNKITDQTDNFSGNQPPETMKPKTSEDVELEGPKDIPFTRPRDVVDALIHAANTGKFDTISMLCSKSGLSKENYAWEICHIKAGTPEAKKFQDKFKGAHVSGDVNVNGSFANVPIEYAGGKDRDELRLALEGNKWYLIQVRSYNTGQ